MVYSVLAHSTQIYFNGYPEITFFIMYIAVPITVRLGSESGAKQSAVLIQLEIIGQLGLKSLKKLEQSAIYVKAGLVSNKYIPDGRGEARTYNDIVQPIGSCFILKLSNVKFMAGFSTEQIMHFVSSQPK